MTGPHREAILSLLGRSSNSGQSPGSLADIAARAREVAAVCAKPAYRNVGAQGCHWLKNTHNDPAQWCSVAPRWKELLTARADAEVARKIGSFTHRPLLFHQLVGDQHLQFFARAVPNAEGWREASSWSQLHLDPATRDDYLAGLNQMYQQIGIDKRVVATDLAPIEAAFAQLRADAEAARYPMPASAGRDYSVGLAKKQVTRFAGKVRVRSAFLSRSSWRVHKNELGVPLHRTRPGYVLAAIPGTRMCQLIGYTVTETFTGRGYQRASGVRFGASRFQPCR